MNIFLLLILIIVGIFLLLFLLLPSQIKVSVSKNIDAPIGKVFNQVNELKNWPSWSPWYKLDPNQEMTYSKPSRGQGAFYNWKSDHKQVDKGKLTLHQVESEKKIVLKLEFEKWGSNLSTIHFSTEKNTTKITWEMSNKMKGMMKMFAPMMKKQLTQSFTVGINGIKSLVEK